MNSVVPWETRLDEYVASVKEKGEAFFVIESWQSLVKAAARWVFDTFSSYTITQDWVIAVSNEDWIDPIYDMLKEVLYGFMPRVHVVCRDDLEGGAVFLMVEKKMPPRIEIEYH